MKVRHLIKNYDFDGAKPSVLKLVNPKNLQNKTMSVLDSEISLVISSKST